MGEESFVVNESFLYYFHNKDILNGFISLDNDSSKIQFNTAKLADIDKCHPDYELVCSYMLNMFNCNIQIKYDDIIRIINHFKYAVEKGFPINPYRSTKPAILYRRQIPEADIHGVKIELLMVDICNLLTLCKFDHAIVWDFIGYYLDLLDPADLAEDSPVVKSIIISVLCIADINPNDNIGTLIDVLIAKGISFHYIYYELVFKLYIIQYHNYNTAIHYHRLSYNTVYNITTIKLVELGIRKGIKVSNEIIEYLKWSYYDIPFMSEPINLTHIHSLLLNTLYVIHDNNNDCIDDIKDILENRFSCSILTISSYITALRNKSWPGIIENVSYISKLQALLNGGYITMAKKQVNTSIGYMESIEPVFNDRGSLIDVCKMYETYRSILTEIYANIVIGFRINIPVNDDTLYLYKKLNSNNINNYSVWKIAHNYINRKSCITKLDFIINHKCIISTRVNTNFVSLREFIADYF